MDAQRSSSQLALHGPPELEVTITSAMRTYGSASASCSYVHAFEVCTCAHPPMAFCDYAGPPITQGRRVRHRTSPPYSLATSASGVQQWIHNFDSRHSQTLSKPKATISANMHDKQSTAWAQVPNLIAAWSTCQPVQKRCTHPQTSILPTKQLCWNRAAAESCKTAKRD